MDYNGNSNASKQQDFINHLTHLCTLRIGMYKFSLQRLAGTEMINLIYILVDIHWNICRYSYIHWNISSKQLESHYINLVVSLLILHLQSFTFCLQKSMRRPQDR